MLTVPTSTLLPTPTRFMAAPFRPWVGTLTCAQPVSFHPNHFGAFCQLPSATSDGTDFHRHVALYPDFGGVVIADEEGHRLASHLTPGSYGLILQVTNRFRLDAALDCHS
jgi:hypothetical protein